ncbi:hypothetical protein DL769_004759 [Monosporascus sp. CRB-8-3]|nr:hypothetical protein DL769_004759 [Monosporascus sp. CRB-8-3]
MRDSESPTPLLQNHPYTPEDIKTEEIKQAAGLGLISVIDIKAKNLEQVNPDETQPQQYELKVVGRIQNADAVDNLASLDDNTDLDEPEQSKPEYDKLKVVKALSDSLVDQEVQHRLLTSPDLRDPLLRLLVYVFHPESVDCLANYRLRVSMFSCQKRDPWVANITLRSWSLIRIQKKSRDNDNISEPYEDQDNSSDDGPIELPESLLRDLKHINRHAFETESSNPHRVVLTLSSIVLSTNSFGDFSKCSIITSLISNGSIRVIEQAKEELMRQINEVIAPESSTVAEYCFQARLIVSRMPETEANNWRECARRIPWASSSRAPYRGVY